MFRADTTAGSSRSFVRASWAAALPRKNRGLFRGGFSLVAVLADFLAILGTGVLANVTYARAADVVADTHIRLGLLVAVLFTFMSAIRNEYAISKYLTFENQVGRSVLPWCMTIVGTLVITLSARPLIGSLALAFATYFIGGFSTLNLGRLLLTYGIRTYAKRGQLAARRIFLLGYEDELNAFAQRHEPWLLGIHIIAASVLRGAESLEEDLALALASARILEPDDVFILVPWSHKMVIDAAIQAFLRIPTSIHLGPERVLDRFSGARVSTIGRMSSLNLVRGPLSTSEVIAKRLFDIFFASLGLALLAPLFIIVGIAIKLDSPGPVMFRQRRYGFNQQPFRMLKFRSMHTLEDDFEADPGQRERRAGDALRKVHPSSQHRRVAAAHQCSAWGNVARRPTAARSGDRSDVRAQDRALRAPAQCQAGHYRLGADQWISRRNGRGTHAGARGARPPLHRPLVDVVRHRDSVADIRLEEGLYERPLRAWLGRLLIILHVGKADLKPFLLLVAQIEGRGGEVDRRAIEIDGHRA